MTVYGVVYKITNKVNSTVYVGQTKRTIKERFIEHAKAETHLGYAIRKYGRKKFTIEVIEECETAEQLNEREIFWIAKLNTKAPNGYNYTEGGEGLKGPAVETLAKMRGHKRSPEALAHLKVASKKRANTPEGKANLENMRKSRWEKEKARPPEERGWIRRCRKNVFPIIEAELRSRKIKYSTLAEAIGLPKGNIERKLGGKVGFSMEEAEAIRTFLGLDMSLEELFSRDDGFGAEKTFSSIKKDWNTYPALKAALECQKISIKKLAEHLDLTSSSVTRKLQGKVGFSDEQKAAIRDFLGIDMPLEELFKRRD